jgi:hypothetical protein
MNNVLFDEFHHEKIRRNNSNKLQIIHCKNKYEMYICYLSYEYTF